MSDYFGNGGLFGGDGVIHGTTGYALERGSHDYRPLDQYCPDCGRPILSRSTRCKPCAQQMRRLIEGQVRRLLALADQRRAEREAQ